MWPSALPTDQPNDVELPCPVPKVQGRKRRQGPQSQHGPQHATVQHQQAGGGGTLSQISGVRKVSLTSGAVVSRFGVKTDQEELLSKVRPSHRLRQASDRPQTGLRQASD